MRGLRQMFSETIAMSHLVPLLGSAYHPPGSPRAGHRRIGQLTTQQRREDIEVSVYMRERGDGPSVQQSLAWLAAQPPAARRHLDGQRLRDQHGYAPADRDRLVRWAQESGLCVTGDNPALRRVTLRGPAEKLGQLFGVDLARYSVDTAGGRVDYRGHSGPVRLPAPLAGSITAVLGLDDRPAAHPQVRQAGPMRPGLVSYEPSELASIYAYPRLPDDGAGMHLVAGMIELGGTVHAPDVAAAFQRLGLTPPSIVNVSVDGAAPQSDPAGADVEVALDYQVIGAMVLAVAPRAELTIVSYNAPNTERGFVDAVAAAAADDTRRPAAVSISWGSAEDSWSLQGMRAMDATFAAGSLRGLTYSAAAGDQGSANAEYDGFQHPEFPASSPHVWACGGTTLLAVRGRIVSETVWKDRKSTRLNSSHVAIS